MQEWVKIVLFTRVTIPCKLQEPEEEKRLAVVVVYVVGVDELVGEGVSSANDDDPSVGEDLV